MKNGKKKVQKKRKKKEQKKKKVEIDEIKIWNKLVRLARGWHKVIEPYLTPLGRKRLLRKFGRKAFLLPDKLKFPVVNPRTGKVDPRGLAAAVIRADLLDERKREYEKVRKKALRMLRKMGLI